MGRLTILILAIFSLSASAKTRIDRYTGSIGTAEFPGVVRVPLYAGPNGEPFPAVKVMIGDTPYLFALAPSENIIFVNDDLVKAEELKSKTGNKTIINLHGEDGEHQLGGKREWVEIEQMSIGGMVLRDVVAATSDPNADASSHQSFKKRIVGDRFAGVIGLGALPDEVSWAIQPSTGTVSFAAGDQVAEINALQGGTALPYRTLESKEFKFEKEKFIRLEVDLIVDGTVGGSEAAIVLGSGFSSFFGSWLPVDESLVRSRGDVDFHHIDIHIGGKRFGTEWMRSLGFEVFVKDYLGFDASTGLDMLSGVDISVNRDTRTVTLAPAAEQHRKDPLPFMVDALTTRIGLESGEAKGEEEAEDADDAEGAEGGDDADEDTEVASGSAALWSDLADLHAASGDLTAEIEARARAVTIDQNSCPEQIRLGKAQLKLGQIGDAITTFEIALNQYQSWYRFSADTRAVLEEHEDKAWDDLSNKDQKLIKAGLDTDEDPGSMMEATHPATSSCHTVAGLLAAATLAAGDAQTVASLYSSHLDLDPDLARIAASALISQGEFAAAQAPLRQAIKMTRTPNANTRLGLALVYANSGDWEMASGHFERAMTGPVSSANADAWLAALTDAVGEAGALDALAAHVKSHPTQAAGHYGLARAAGTAETGRAGAKIRARGDSFFKAELADLSRDGGLWAIYARYLVATDRSDQAQEAVDMAVKLASDKADTWLAQADLAEANGEAGAAQEYRIKAAQLDPWNPALAQLLGN